MSHLYCWFAVQAMIWSMYLIWYPPRQLVLFFGCWMMLRDVQYILTQIVCDVPRVSTQDDIALHWEDFYEKNFIIRERKDQYLSVARHKPASLMCATLLPHFRRKCLNCNATVCQHFILTKMYCGVIVMVSDGNAAFACYQKFPTCHFCRVQVLCCHSYQFLGEILLNSKCTETV